METPKVSWRTHTGWDIAEFDQMAEAMIVMAEFHRLGIDAQYGAPADAGT